VQGWVTLTNSSGTTFEDAKTLLVAGAPALMPTPGTYRGQPARNNGLQRAGTESGTRERLADFYLYPLAERTTLANLQTKQVSFLDVHGVPAEHGYEYHNSWLGTTDMPQSAQSMYRFSTGAHAGLGDQLPAGTLRFYMRDKRGEPQFIGENSIGHTPMGSTLSLATGEAFDVKVKTTVDRRKQLGPYKWESDMHYELSNALPRPVVVKLLQEGLVGDTRIKSESQKSVRLSDRVAAWEVTVPANGKADLTATFESSF
jgi:hypothetical protein